MTVEPIGGWVGGGGGGGWEGASFPIIRVGDLPHACDVIERRAERLILLYCMLTYIGVFFYGND